LNKRKELTTCFVLENYYYIPNEISLSIKTDFLLRPPVGVDGTIQLFKFSYHPKRSPGSTEIADPAEGVNVVSPLVSRKEKYAQQKKHIVNFIPC